MSTTMQPQSGVLVGGERAGLRGKLDKKLGDLRSLGVGGFVRKAFRDHVYRLREYVILESWLDPDAAMPSDPEGLMVVEPNGPIPDFTRHFPAQAAKYEKAIRGGCLAFVVLKDDAVVAVSFGSLQDYYEEADGYWFRLGDGDAYLFNWLVPPEQRSFAVASRLVKFSNAWLAARGYRRAYCVVEPWNVPSAGSLLFLGYQEAGELIRIHRLLGRFWSTRRAYTEPRFPRFKRKRARR